MTTKNKKVTIVNAGDYFGVYLEGEFCGSANSLEEMWEIIARSVVDVVKIDLSGENADRIIDNGFPDNLKDIKKR
jgi:hypothetical protein